MTNISSNALVLLIQILDEKIHLLKTKIDELSEDDEELPDYEEELLSCTKVADELFVSYKQALETIGNLPPYEDLVQNIKLDNK